MPYQSPGGAFADSMYQYQLDRAALQHQQLVDSLAVQRNRREDELEQLALGEKKYQSEREKVQQEIESMDIGAFYSPELLERAKKYNVPLHDRRKTVTAAGLPEVQQMPALATETPRVAPGAGASVRAYAGTPVQQFGRRLSSGEFKTPESVAGGALEAGVKPAEFGALERFVQPRSSMRALPGEMSGQQILEMTTPEDRISVTGAPLTIDPAGRYKSVQMAPGKFAFQPLAEPRGVGAYWTPNGKSVYKITVDADGQQSLTPFSGEIPKGARVFRDPTPPATRLVTDPVTGGLSEYTPTRPGLAGSVRVTPPAPSAAPPSPRTAPAAPAAAAPPATAAPVPPASPLGGRLRPVVTPNKIDVAPITGAEWSTALAEHGNEPLPGKANLTPNALSQAAISLALTGKVPTGVTYGLGSKGLRREDISAMFQNQADAFATQAGTSTAELQREYAGQSAATKSVARQYMAMDGMITAADSNFSAARQIANGNPNITRTESKWLNEQAQRLEKGLTPAAGQTEFEIFFSRGLVEWQKATSGAAGSVRELSEGAAHRADALLSTANSPESFNVAIDAIHNEMQRTRVAYGKALQSLSPTIKNFIDIAMAGRFKPSTIPDAPPPPMPGDDAPAGIRRRLGRGGD